MPYAIVDWDEIYEKARTREVAAMTWVAIPNKQDGEGYACLVEDDPDGPAHYGAWVALVLVASKCPSRGVLIRKDGTALTPRAIAKKARLPVDLMKAAIPRFLQIGWLCELTAPPSHAGTTMHDDVVQASDNVVQDRADAHYTTGQNTKRKPGQDRTGQDEPDRTRTGERTDSDLQQSTWRIRISDRTLRKGKTLTTDGSCPRRSSGLRRPPSGPPTRPAPGSGSWT